MVEKRVMKALTDYYGDHNNNHNDDYIYHIDKGPQKRIIVS